METFTIAWTEPQLFYRGLVLVVIAVALTYLSGKHFVLGHWNRSLGYGLGSVIFLFPGVSDLRSFGPSGNPTLGYWVLAYVALIALMASAFFWGYLGHTNIRKMLVHASTIVSTAFAIIVFISD